MAKVATTFRLSAGFKPELEKLAQAEHCAVSSLIKSAVQEFLDRRAGTREKNNANKKPACSDFIVAAVRQIRNRPTNLKPGTYFGAAIQKIYKVALAVYTDQEFRSGLETLMKSGYLIVVGHGCEQVVKDGNSREGSYGDDRIFTIASDMPLDNRKRWYLDEAGHPVDENQEGRHQLFLSILLYVRADGLPQRIERLLSPSTRGGKMITAQKIIESMQKAR